MPRDIRILLIGQASPWMLEGSYQRAFAELGCQVELFDLAQAVSRHARLGKFGRLFNAFVPVESWIRKANRELFQKVRDWQPHILISLAQYPVQAGLLAQLKASMPAVHLVYIWPDPLINWSTHLSAGLRLYDLVATYSQATVPLFEKMGAPQVAWVPLAADPVLHPRLDPTQIAPEYQADVSFVGGWRPEREALLSQLGGFNLKIWGPDWGRRCRHNPVIIGAWQKRAVRGVEFSRIIAGTRLNLNIVDVGNYPAANMRFFEIPVAGGLQLCSRCPELEDEFQDGKHLFYYQQLEDLPDLMRELLADELRGRTVAAAAHDQILAGHLYQHRAQEILAALGMVT